MELPLALDGVVRGSTAAWTLLADVSFVPSFGICRDNALEHCGEHCNFVNRSLSSVSESTETSGGPMEKCAEAFLNIHVGSEQMVSSGNRQKMYSPERSFLLLHTRSDWP
jgi:hypothetical protein